MSPRSNSNKVADGTKMSGFSSMSRMYSVAFWFLGSFSSRYAIRTTVSRIRIGTGSSLCARGEFFEEVSLGVPILMIAEFVPYERSHL